MTKTNVERQHIESKDALVDLLNIAYIEQEHDAKAKRDVSIKTKIKR